MKTWCVLCGTAVVGIALGVLRTYIDMRHGAVSFMPEAYAVLASERDPDVRPAEPGKLPKVVVVGSAEYDFGGMERQTAQQHTFRLKNVGEAPLQVEIASTSCACTVGSLSKGRLEPGETVDIAVEWSSSKVKRDEVDFKQSVLVKTSDPDQSFVELTIHGYITDSVRVLPEKLSVGRTPVNETLYAEFRLFSFSDQRLDIVASEWEHRETAGSFELAWEPLPAAEVAVEKGATAGLLGKVAIKPGLPLGPINQTIVLKVRTDRDLDVRIPIVGWALSDIRLASSPGFDASRNVVSLGVVPRDKTVQAVLQMYVTGPHRHETHFSVAEVDPASHLTVTVSEPRELNQGKALQYTVTIAALGTAGPVNRLGSDVAPAGHVVLATTHPQTKQIPIDVRFAVE